MLQAASLPRLSEVQRQQQARESADIVVTLREALRLTGFKTSTVSEGAALFKKEQKRDSKRIAYLITGDAFRSSSRGLESSTCTEESEEPQRVACKTQLSNVIKPMEAAGYQVSVYGVTYPCSGGQSLVQSLPDMFDTYMKGFGLVTRSNVTYGGQVTSWRAAVAQVMNDSSSSSIDAFDYYIITRWDLRALDETTPEFWQCVLDGKRVARHLGHLHSYTTEQGWGLLNMDFMMIVHGSLMDNLYDMLLTDSEKCCSTQPMGSACVLCADNLNSNANATDSAPISCPGFETSLQLSKTAPLPPSKV
jgi:hypothetical protein